MGRPGMKVLSCSPPVQRVRRRRARRSAAVSPGGPAHAHAAPVADGRHFYDHIFMARKMSIVNYGCRRSGLAMESPVLAKEFGP